MLNHLSPGQEEAYRQEFIAHEIHDGACQYAIAAQMAFEKFRHEAMTAGLNSWSYFDAGTVHLKRAIEELRELIWGLVPAKSTATDLVVAVEQLGEEMREAGGPDMRCCHEINENKLSPELKRVAFRIVQELIANASRHSKSKRLFVELRIVGELLRIKVRDWGIGFDPDDVPPGHFGLEGIRRRVKLLHGVATIESKPDRGTCVTVDLPFAPPETN